MTSTYLADTAIVSQDIVGTDVPFRTLSADQFSGRIRPKARRSRPAAMVRRSQRDFRKPQHHLGRGYAPTPGTGGAAPGDQPVIVATVPVSNTVGVDPDLRIRATFDMAMDDATINATNFTLVSAVESGGGQVYYDGGSLTAAFDPDKPLAAAPCTPPRSRPPSRAKAAPRWAPTILGLHHCSSGCPPTLPRIDSQPHELLGRDVDSGRRIHVGPVARPGLYGDHGPLEQPQ